MSFQNFTLADGKLVQVPMMSRTSNEISAAKFNLSEIEDVFQTVAIPYAVRCPVDWIFLFPNLTIIPPFTSQMARLGFFLYKFS